MAEDNRKPNDAFRAGGLYRVGGKAVDANGQEVEGGIEILDKADKAEVKRLEKEQAEQAEAMATQSAGGMLQALQVALGQSKIATKPRAASQEETEQVSATPYGDRIENPVAEEGDAPTEAERFAADGDPEITEVEGTTRRRRRS